MATTLEMLGLILPLRYIFPRHHRGNARQPLRRGRIDAAYPRVGMRTAQVFTDKHTWNRDIDGVLGCADYLLAGR